MSSSFESLIARAESLMARLEAVLPHAPPAPDWQASIAFRYRKRGGNGVLEPVRHVATIRLADLQEVVAPHAFDLAGDSIAVLDDGEHIFLLGHQALNRLVKAENGAHGGDSALEHVVPLNQVEDGLIAV